MGTTKADRNFLAVNIFAEKPWIRTKADRKLLNNGMERDIQKELPSHKVTLAVFAICKYPVTQAQWQAVMGNNPSKFKGADRPVENVSWHDIQKFLQKLNKLCYSDRGLFRLPTEVEWEYACRAGKQTIWPFGNDPAQLRNYVWYNENSGGQTHPVGQLQPNAWGLFDMLGNIWEWCQDWFEQDYYAKSPKDNPQGPASGSDRVLRGGGFDNNARYCRSASRSRGAPDSRNHCVGFRLVRTLL
jgi:formylglycine-generating enzyme required for sulfatase activity